MWRSAAGPGNLAFMHSTLRRSVLAVLTAPLALSSAATSSADEAGEAPRLVVLVAIDQMIPEQLTRLEPWLEGGLGRFAREGHVFTRARLGYARTETGPGHTTFASGVQPWTHGVVGNSFFDREAQNDTYCVRDTDARILRAEGPAADGLDAVSPRNIRVPSLGDHVLAARPGARIVSIAGKDRAAVGMGGQSPEVALWWDRRGGGFVTSNHYVEALPDWVQAWNEGWVERVAGRVWEPSFAGELTGSGTDLDQRPGERAFFGRTTFPYTLPEIDPDAGDRALAGLASATFATPWMDGFVVDLARAAIEARGLGADEVTDVLALGLSACDVVGHSFGPYSHEVTDVLLRADRALGELFALLDERVGEGRWVACLSADHGVLELPETLQRQQLGGARIDREGIGALVAEGRTALEDVFGTHFELGYRSGGLCLDADALAQADVDPAEVRELIKELVLTQPWVEAAYTYDELLETYEARGAGETDSWRLLWARSFVPDRAADVAVQTRPWHLLGGSGGTSHGSPYIYDRRVPLAFLGPGFEARTSADVVDIVDALPTLLDALGLSPASELEGRVLR